MSTEQNCISAQLDPKSKSYYDR